MASKINVNTLLLDDRSRRLLVLTRWTNTSDLGLGMAFRVISSEFQRQQTSDGFA